MIYTLIAAMSRDGYIADSAGKTLTTSASDKLFLREQLATHDVHLYGRKTFADVAPKPSPHHKTYVLSREAHPQEPTQSGAVFVTSLEDLFAPKQHGNKALILGGASLYTYAVENGIASIIYLTVTSEVLGDGTPFLHESGLLAKNYVLVSTVPMGGGEELRMYQKLTSS